MSGCIQWTGRMVAQQCAQSIDRSGKQPQTSGNRSQNWEGEIMKATNKRCASCGGSGLAQSHPGACWQCLGTGRMRPNLPSKAATPKNDRRSCFDCDHNYCGGIDCPACGNASGEPLNR